MARCVCAVALTAADQQGEHHIAAQQQYGACVQWRHRQRRQPQPNRQPRAACSICRPPLQRRLPQPTSATQGAADWPWVLYTLALQHVVPRICAGGCLCNLLLYRVTRDAPHSRRWLADAAPPMRLPFRRAAGRCGGRPRRPTPPQQLRASIQDLIQLRRRAGLHCRSQVLALTAPRQAVLLTHINEIAIGACIESP